MVSYQCTIGTTQSQAVFERDLIFNITSVVEWQVVTVNKKRHVNIYNARESTKQVIFDYAVGNIVYVNITGNYRKLCCNKYGLCRIT